MPEPSGDEQPNWQSGGRTGLLVTETEGGFAYGRHAGSAGSAGSARSAGSAASGEVAEPRFRWRLGIRAAGLVGALSLIAGALFWWQVAASGPVVLPFSPVTHDAEERPMGGARDQEGSGPDSGGTESSLPDGEGKDADRNDADGTNSVGTNRVGTNSDGTAARNAVVHVAGAVKKAGVVRLPRGSRVHEAIAAAGGASPEADLDRLNLAAPLDDGQKIYVPRRGEPAPADKSAPAGASGADTAETEGTAGPAGEGSGGKINLNTATAEELAELPKVGPILAQRIVDWRTQQGPFKSPEELDAVDGVGPKMLETLLPLVTV